MHQERQYPARVYATDLVNPDFAALARCCQWQDLERYSGLTRGAMEAAAAVYARAHAVIGIYGMGLTQHRKGVENVQMMVNLLLGRPVLRLADLAV